jgi:hypothetical protein
MQPLSTTFLIERPLIYASLYDLGVVVFGSEGLARLSTGDDRDEFDKLRVRHETAQATKLLIENAVLLRNLLDSGSWPIDAIHEIRIERRPEKDVGILRVPGNPEQGLSFREACNKIIHAEQVSFGMKTLSGKLACLDGVVELHGKRGRQTWVAEIQLSDFIRMAVRQL